VYPLVLVSPEKVEDGVTALPIRHAGVSRREGDIKAFPDAERFTFDDEVPGSLVDRSSEPEVQESFMCQELSARHGFYYTAN
jgi:hypothetical protein